MLNDRQLIRILVRVVEQALNEFGIDFRLRLFHRTRDRHRPLIARQSGHQILTLRHCLRQVDENASTRRCNRTASSGPHGRGWKRRCSPSNKSLTNAVASSRFIEAAIDAPPESDLKFAKPKQFLELIDDYEGVARPRGLREIEKSPPECQTWNPADKPRCARSTPR